MRLYGTGNILKINSNEQESTIAKITKMPHYDETLSTQGEDGLKRQLFQETELSYHEVELEKTGNFEN